jgi:hypothetical protein
LVARAKAGIPPFLEGADPKPWGTALSVFIVSKLFGQVTAFAAAS